MMRTTLVAVLALMLGMVRAGNGGEDGKGGQFKHQVSGLFADGREPALREAIGRIPGVKLVELDRDEAVATLEYDPARLFPGARPEEIVERLDNLLRSASNHTLGFKPMRTKPRDQLKKVELAVAGLDCEACSLALYEILSRVEGVELVKASFHEGRAIAWIDPDRTDRARLVEALRRREVDVRSP
jgi:copper chaperone CopZ